ncbi:Saccharopine dehydrogenase-like oxidoreductase [Argiope bruennichi]|uniref:Saccharopine dehydrogenase-like oxidoreductase n=1 Tax=Argiope bruennichi TaxID=94029 RepID=A0A8T0FYP4_ARGBR|nr:Saccharopine dehydrogenase-like oxidoreductase [Argiope bruennichi]
MSAPISKEYDIIILGASGLTGRYAMEELSQCVTESSGLKWAIAGRNTEKLKRSLENVRESLPKETDIRSPPIIKADVQDPSSIHEMCKRTKLLLNCVGPYDANGGEMIVATCIECRTHCVEISAEIKYLDKVLAKYFDSARKAGVYIVQSCGFGSLPADYGIALLMKKFAGGLNSVEYFVEILEGPRGISIGFGTFSSCAPSMVDYFKYEFEQDVEKVGKPSSVNSSFSVKKLIKKPLVKYSFKEKSLCLNFLGPDRRNIVQSQILRANVSNKKMSIIETRSYLKPPSVFKTVSYIFSFLIVAVMQLFAVGIYFTNKYPSFFTLGMFTKSGPSRQQILESGTRFTFYAKGWKNKADADIKQTLKPDKKLKLIINGQEPAYALTAVCMIQSCLTVLFEQEKLPLEGGVYPSGFAFENTNILERLEKRGMTFTFEEMK